MQNMEQLQAFDLRLHDGTVTMELGPGTYSSEQQVLSDNIVAMPYYRDVLNDYHLRGPLHQRVR